MTQSIRAECGGGECAKRRACPKRNLLAAIAWSMLWTSAVTAGDAGPPQVWSPSLMMQVKRIGSVVVSPDGRRVAFTVRQAVMDGDVSEYRTHIHLNDTDGLEPRQLTHGDKSCDDPQWSPDGKWIAFVSARVGKKNLCVIPFDGGEAVQLTEHKSDMVRPPHRRSETLTPRR